MPTWQISNLREHWPHMHTKVFWPFSARCLEHRMMRHVIRLCGWSDVWVARHTWMIGLNMAPYILDGSEIRRMHRLSDWLFRFSTFKKCGYRGNCFTITEYMILLVILEQPSTTPFIQFQACKNHCIEVWVLAPSKCTRQTCFQHRINITFNKQHKTTLNENNEPLWVPVYFLVGGFNRFKKY